MLQHTCTVSTNVRYPTCFTLCVIHEIASLLPEKVFRFWALAFLPDLEWSTSQSHLYYLNRTAKHAHSEFELDTSEVLAAVT